MSKKAFSNSPAAMGKQMAQHLTNNIISAAVEAVEAIGKEPKFKHDETYRAINKLRDALDLFGPQVDVYEVRAVTQKAIERKLPTFSIPAKTTHFQNDPVDPEEKHFAFNVTSEWQGYTIQRKKGLISLAGNEAGYVVTKLGCNVMPGAVWFPTVADARKGIAAWKLACKIAPIDRVLPELENGSAEVFWNLMELSKK